MLSPVTVEPLGAAREDEALAFLHRAPVENVFLASLLARGTGSGNQRSLFVALDGGNVAGVAYFGRQIVFAGGDAAIDAFSAENRLFRGARGIVGPRAGVRRLWTRIAPWHPAPRVVRERQLVMAVDDVTLKRTGDGVTVRRARHDEWREVVEHSARMIEHELDYDPRESSPDFAANVRYMIERDWWWIGESGSRKCFFCHVGPQTPHTAQLQGIWVPPELRGNGFATAALSQICAELLADFETLSLYVNDFNAPAIALYERVGFVTVAEFQTLLF